MDENNPVFYILKNSLFILDRRILKNIMQLVVYTRGLTRIYSRYKGEGEQHRFLICSC